MIPHHSFEQNEFGTNVPPFALEAEGNWETYNQFRQRDDSLYVENIKNIVERGYEELDTF